MEELPGRNQFVTWNAETAQFVPLSSGTGLDSKLLYHEDKRYLDITKVFNVFYIQSIF